MLDEDSDLEPTQELSAEKKKADKIVAAVEVS